MSTHNICFHGEVRKNSMWIPPLMCSYESYHATIMPGWTKLHLILGIKCLGFFHQSKQNKDMKNNEI